MSHCCQIFAPPAARSRRIILTHAKTLRQSLKGTQNSFQRLSQAMRQAYSTNYKSSTSLRLNNTKSPCTKMARQVHWNFSSMLAVSSAFRQLWIMNLSHTDKLNQHNYTDTIQHLWGKNAVKMTWKMEYGGLFSPSWHCTLPLCFVCEFLATNRM